MSGKDGLTLFVFKLLLLLMQGSFVFFGIDVEVLGGGVSAVIFVSNPTSVEVKLSCVES